jgi:beta-lactamase class C
LEKSGAFLRRSAAWNILFPSQLVEGRPQTFRFTGNKHSMRVAPLILVAALIACSAAAGANAVNDSDVGRLIERQLPVLLGEDGIGGVAVAVRIGGRTLFFNHGWADVANRHPVTANSLFNIASVRKVFEAIVLAHTVQRGELRFDDRVEQYVPELRQGGTIREVTLGQLASHTSGLLLPPDHPPWPEHGYTLEGFIGALNTWTPEAGQRPGQTHTYTHAGYVLLQLALERRFGLPIGQLIDRRVLKPLGMDATVLPAHPLDGEHAPLPDAVQGYGEDGEPIGVPGNQQSYYDFPGTGQMFSSARDLATLLTANLGDGRIDPDLRAAMQLAQRSVFRISPRNAQALAWELNNFGGPTIVDKPGGIDNASAYLGMVPDQRLGIVILVNRGSRNPYEVARNIILPELARF